MASILFLIEIISCKVFRCNYLGNKNLLAIFLFFLFLHFKDLGSIFISFKKKMTRTADVYLNLQASKDLVR